MNTRNRWLGLGILLLSIPTALSCTDVDIQTPDWDWDPDWPVVKDTRFFSEASFESGPHSGSKLSLTGVAGIVEIVGSPSAPGITVRGTRRVRSESEADAHRHLSDLQVEVGETNGTVYVTTLQPKRSNGRIYEVDYLITVPESIDLILNQISGPVDVRSVRGDLEIVGMGSDIALEIAKDASAMLRASTLSGTIRLVNLELRSGDSSRYLVEGRLNGGEGNIRLKTLSGDITVRGVDSSTGG